MELNSTISSDGRLLIFGRAAVGGRPQELWMSVRENVNTTWPAPTRIDTLNADFYTRCPRLLPDEKSFLFSSSRPNYGRGEDVYVARLVRTDSPVEPITGFDGDAELEAIRRDAGWEVRSPERIPISVTSGADVSADRLVVVVSHRSNGKAHLWTSSRTSLDEPWSQPEKLPESVSLGSEVQPSLSPGGRRLAFHRLGGETFVVERESTSGPWSEPKIAELGGYYPPDLYEDRRFAIVTDEHGRLSVLRKERIGADWSERQLDEDFTALPAHGSATISEDGCTLVFTKRVSDELESASGLWISRREDDQSEWPSPALVDTGRFVTSSHPRLLPAGKSLLFVGDERVYVAELAKRDAPVEPNEDAEQPDWD